MKNNLTSYQNWLKRQDLATNTINNYLQVINLYGNKSLTTNKLRDYVKKNLANYQPSSLYTKIKALTVYTRYKKIKINWERVLRLIPKYQQKFFPTLTEKELEQLKEVRFEENEWIYQRNNLIIDFFFFTGMRVSELIKIKMSDYNNENLKITGKGNKIRYFPLPEFLADKLTNSYSDKYLFTTKHGKMLTRVMVGKIIEMRSKLAKLNKTITPHTFRRTFATLSHNKGTNLTTIQKLLGHSNIETTATYIHNDQKTLYDDYSKLWKDNPNLVNYRTKF